MVVICLLALILAWPVQAAPAPSPRASVPTADRIRQTVSLVAVRIEVEEATARGICTGWIGWSEEERSAAYTAAHCYRPGARYRLMVSGGEAVYATSLTRWDDLDLMALWFPRGRLPALRAWKPMPAGSFRAVYILSELGAPLRLVDVTISRVYWEVRFQSHPRAVALPLVTAPGTSGAPIVDLSDGSLLGMIVGHGIERPDLSVVVTAQSIYDTLITASRR